MRTHSGWRGLVLAAASAAVATPAVALDFHSQEIGPVVEIVAVDDFMTNGADMAGMAVTVHFSNAPSETAIWAVTGPTSGGAFGLNQDWSLTVADDTFWSPWTLVYTGNKGLLTGFSIDGMAAGFGEVGVMFDRTFGFEFGTEDSWAGWDYETLSSVPFDTLIHYRSAIALPGEAPVGDLFRYMDVRFVVRPGDEFSGPGVGGLDGVDLRSLSFRQDTDNNIIPEPAALALVGVGTLLLLGRGRRQQVVA